MKKQTYTRFNTPYDGKVYYGWGRKRSGYLAIKKAQEKKGKFILREDGFLRSVYRHDEALSIVEDDLGIYYDANQPSQLENAIQCQRTVDEEARVNALLTLWRTHHLSKYNASDEYQGYLPDKYVLLIDQVFNDSSVTYGMADESSFQRMVDSALENHPDANLIIKIHPDYFDRNKKSYFSLITLPNNDRIILLNEQCHPVRLIKEAQAIYTVTSQVGFEGLIWGKPVYCFGMPFYAGWGLTFDSLSPPARRKVVGHPITLAQLAYASLICYPKYYHPERRALCEVEEMIDYIIFQRQQAKRFPSTAYALNFSPWKKRILPYFLRGTSITFVDDIAKLPEEATVIVWGKKQHRDMALHRFKRLLVEDGFIRSVGLGIDFTFPLSWAIDSQTVHYDCQQASDLETLLNETTFSQEIVDRSEQLRLTLIASHINKYNVVGQSWVRPQIEKTVILIPGQVESDASLAYGSLTIKKNWDLIVAVRQQHPDAYVVYKPHPDVESGIRRGKISHAKLLTLVDEVLYDADILNVLAQVDEVHTLTSLTGFEALIRGKSVTCYGLPFYAGWGLTKDKMVSDRRTRTLSCQELIAGALIMYPLYIHPESKHYITPEFAIDYLITQKAHQARYSVKRTFRRIVMKILNVLLNKS